MPKRREIGRAAMAKVSWREACDFPVLRAVASERKRAPSLAGKQTADSKASFQSRRRGEVRASIAEGYLASGRPKASRRPLAKAAWRASSSIFNRPSRASYYESMPAGESWRHHEIVRRPAAHRDKPVNMVVMRRWTCLHPCQPSSAYSDRHIAPATLVLEAAGGMALLAAARDIKLIKAADHRGSSKGNNGSVYVITLARHFMYVSPGMTSGKV